MPSLMSSVQRTPVAKSSAAMALGTPAISALILLAGTMASHRSPFTRRGDSSTVPECDDPQTTGMLEWCMWEQMAKDCGLDID